MCMRLWNVPACLSYCALVYATFYVTLGSPGSEATWTPKGYSRLTGTRVHTHTSKCRHLLLRCSGCQATYLFATVVQRTGLTQSTASIPSIVIACMGTPAARISRLICSRCCACFNCLRRRPVPKTWQFVTSITLDFDHVVNCLPTTSYAANKTGATMINAIQHCASVLGCTAAARAFDRRTVEVWGDCN